MVKITSIAITEDDEKVRNYLADQIRSWRHERLMDVGFGGRSRVFSDGLLHLESGTPDEAVRAAVTSRLADFRAVFEYESAVLVDTTGRIGYAASDDEQQLAPAELAAIDTAAGTDGAVMSEFFVIERGQPRISVIAPVRDAVTGRTLGFLVLRRNPENLIFPLVRRWPTPSAAAESLLLTADGDAIRFVPGMQRRPAGQAAPALGSVETESRRALRAGGPVTIEGLDYRGTEVIARAEPIAGTAWVLTAKVDRDEILAEVHYRGVAILGFMLLGTLLAALTVMLLADRRHQRSERALLEAERERLEALEDAGTSRQQLRGVVDATTDRIAAIDLDYRYIAFNRAYATDFERLFGARIAPHDSLLDRLAHLPGELERVRTVWGRALAGEQFVTTVEYGDEQHERGWFELAFSPMRDEAGAVIGAVHINRDVTERVRAERALAASEAHLRHLNDDLERVVDERTRELVEARDLAESSNRIKDIFLATMSHELRTPLNSIIGFSDILLSGIAGELNAEQRTQLGIIHKSGQQLLALISDVLDISKIEAGQLRLTPAAVPLHEVLREQQHVFELQARERGLGMRFDYPETPVLVRADAQRLRQVIGNLLSNALKFTDRGEVGLRVEARDGKVRVTVEDTGIGIGAEEVAQLFQPFRRVAPKLGHNRDGTGLGLAISRRLVEAMGGEIGVDSTPGRGSRFWFTLPLASP